MQHTVATYTVEHWSSQQYARRVSYMNFIMGFAHHRVSVVRFLMVTWNFFFVPHLWQGEKYLSLYWEHVTYFCANHMNRSLQWLLCCWNWSNKPLPWWEGVMSRQHLCWSYVLGLACCVGAFYCNHVLNICDFNSVCTFLNMIYFFTGKDY